MTTSMSFQFSTFMVITDYTVQERTQAKVDVSAELNSEGELTYNYLVHPYDCKIHTDKELDLFREVMRKVVRKVTISNINLLCLVSISETSFSPRAIEVEWVLN